MTNKDALPCPFCNVKPVVEDWAGKDKHGVVIYCKNAFCFAAPSVIGRTLPHALQYWNTRGGK
jgi:hypothetical protein